MPTNRRHASRKRVARVAAGQRGRAVKACPAPMPLPRDEPRSNPICGQEPTGVADGVDAGEDFYRRADHILRQQGAVESLEERREFTGLLWRMILRRENFKRCFKSFTAHDDIVALIHDAIRAGGLDEAVWRCFLAVHFGRLSAENDRQFRSAARFLFAFHNAPFWTWKRVSKNPRALHDWLMQHGDDLATLRYGNHRKRRSPRPKPIWLVIESFVSLATKYGSPMKLISDGLDSGLDAFNAFYRRLKQIYDFGRLGRFDLLVLLLDARLITAEPKSC